MPSNFPPPSVERHHSRRRSGRYSQDDPEAQIGTYSNSRPNSGHYNYTNDGVNPPQTYQPPRSSHENPAAKHQDPYYQATTPVGAYQDPSTIAPQLSYTPNHDYPTRTHHRPSSGPTTQHPQNTSTYQAPTNYHHTPHHVPHRNQHHARNQRNGFFSSFGRRRGARTDALESRSRGGRWEDIRAHLVAMSGEFVGTILFLWFALSASQMCLMTNTEPNGAQTPQTILFISLAFGFSLTVNAWAFYRISGGLFNPAVVLGMCVSGNLPWTRGAFLVPAQIVASMIAAALVQAMFPGDVRMVITTLNVGVSITQGLFIEMFLTALLVFTILMLAAEKHQATFIAPVGIGLSLFVAELSGKPLTFSFTDVRV